MSDNITIKYNFTDDGTAVVLNTDNDSLIADIEPGDLEFHSVNERVVSFKPDGTVDINPKFSATEAAQEFWRAVMVLNPWRQ